MVHQICTAPGAPAYVAVDGDRLVGWARLLVMATFQATGTKRMDLVADDAAEGFYQRFARRPMVGYRICPGAR